MKKPALAFGIFLGILNSVLYFLNGFSLYLLSVLLFSLLFILFSFFSKADLNIIKKLSKKDLILILIILAVFIPIYFCQLYQFPRQINSDEVTIMISIKNVLAKPNLDLYGLSDYFGFPNLVFSIFGFFANLIGGVGLLNSRSVHAGSAILIILLTFFFMRLLFNRKFAFLGTVVVGASHSLIGISRMAMRDNSGLLIETAAFIFLLLGLKRRSLLFSFLGGAIAALGFYTYFPGRIIFIIWTISLFLLALFYRKKYPFRVLTRIYLCSLIGFLIIATPVLIATYKEPDRGLKFAQEQLLLYPEGRQLQKEWVQAPNIDKGIKTNIQWGLTVFNNTIVDHGWIYPNFNHGFVDPLTGVLIWVGVGFALFKIKKKEQNLFFVVGLIILILVFAFVINKAPNYTRLLITLPFVGYFVIYGLTESNELLKKTLPKNFLKVFFFVIPLVVVFTVLLWNLNIFNDFIQKGVKEGDDLGNTGRFIESRKTIAGYNYYIVASNNYPYFASSDANVWLYWTSFFAGSNQVLTVVDPNNLQSTHLQKPFTIFTSKQAFELNKDFIYNKFPEIKTTNIKMSGSLVAFEEQ